MDNEDYELYKEFGDILHKTYDELNDDDKLLVKTMRGLTEECRLYNENNIKSIKAKIEDEVFNSQLIHAMKTGPDHEIKRPYTIDKDKLKKCNPRADRIIDKIKGMESFEQKAEIKHYIDIIDKRLEKINDLKRKCSEYEELFNSRPVKSETRNTFINHENPYAEIQQYLVKAISLYIGFFEEQREKLYSFNSEKSITENNAETKQESIPAPEPISELLEINRIYPNPKEPGTYIPTVSLPDIVSYFLDNGLEITKLFTDAFFRKKNGEIFKAADTTIKQAKAKKKGYSE